MQQQLSTFGELQLDDASKIIGCWNGLAKRAGASADGTANFGPDEPPMQRAVAFAKDIKASKRLAEMFPRVVSTYQRSLDAQENEGYPVSDTNRNLYCDVHHVDGTYNALQRNAELAWLKAPVGDGECRILTNARCLSEGVDVPALDAVLFLQPRNSIVDVVQSVGRVMRLSPKKEYGYVILPVAVPAGMDPASALADNVRFKVVWQVLNALRSHDERFDAMINSIALNASGDKKAGLGSDQLLGAHVGPTTDNEALAAKPAQMALFSVGQWQEAIYTRIVDKVGTRVYWEQWAADVADIATAQITRINAILDSPDTRKKVLKQFDRFHKGLRDNLNDAVTRADAISMLSQHLITKPIFDALFAGHDFAAHNPVSQVMQAMADALDGSGLEAETKRLSKFYDSVRLRAKQVVDAQGKQHLIAELYQKFFQTAFKKQSEALGIVYTPVEVVDFILRAADHAAREHLGRGLTDEGVHILDGFTGTGTFITRLLQSDLITPQDLARKYSSELHANEIMLLAYYIAAVNIETTYHALAGKTADTDSYEPFPGIVLADTFQISEHDDTLDLEIFAANNDRIQAQLDTHISVIIGNPPYSVGQASANDLNANTKYPTLDGRIESTYAANSTAQLKNSLYDSYIRAFRWATDRISDAGVVAFVSNGGWVDGNTADGMRLSLAAEYSHLYVYNLRGNARTAGDLRQKEAGNVFGSGSRNTVAIFIGIKDPAHAGACQIHYNDIGDYLTREQKLQIVADENINGTDWQTINPSPDGDWINQRDETFSTWPVIGEKERVPNQTVKVFATYSAGLKTSRDSWCYNFSEKTLISKIQFTADFYNGEVNRLSALPRPLSDVDDVITVDPSRFSWDRINKRQVVQGRKIIFDPSKMRDADYRPFTRVHVYFDPAQQLNNCTYQLPSLFPTLRHTNIGILVTAPGGNAPFTCRMTDLIPDLVSVTGAGNAAQVFPRWTYRLAEDDGTLDIGGADVDEWGYRRVDNITDDILALYRGAVGDQVSKDDIFYYVYGILHDPGYRSRYAADLKKMLPHIPTPETLDRFRHVADIGRQLAELHMNYEDAEPYPLDVQLRPGASASNRETWRVVKMKWKAKTDRSAVVYNNAVTISGIPDAAHDYMLGSRTALEWVIDRYQVKTDKASGIVNDPNDWCDEHDDPTYIVELIKKVTTVSVRTAELVAELSALESVLFSIL
jgi:predicted helicase